MKLMPLQFNKEEFDDKYTSEIKIIRDDQEICVGSMEIDYFNFQSVENNHDTIADRIDRFAAWIWCEVDDYNWSYSVDALMAVNWGHPEHEGLKGNIGILQRIAILPEYRNQGIGTMAMQALMNFFRGKELDYILLLPCPFEMMDKEDFESHRLRLAKLYSSYGFEYFIPSDRDVKHPYMYCNLTYR